jgi:hypothetical protein
MAGSDQPYLAGGAGYYRSTVGGLHGRTTVLVRKLQSPVDHYMQPGARFRKYELPSHLVTQT